MRVRATLPLIAVALCACQSVPMRDTATDTQAPVREHSPAVATATTEPAALPPPKLQAPTPQGQPLPPTSSVAARAPTPETASPEPDLWQQMRDGFALPGCDYAPGTERWARRYAASPRRFAAVLDELLPALEHTHRKIRRAQLPSEFALLPIVESHFRPYPGSEAQPAGIWQIVGGTGRSAGLRMDPWIDERLNLAASTDAAIWLLDRYGDYFQDDWRLAVFAYNAGEYRVRRALKRHRPGEDFASLRGLGLAEASYEYLTKLLALSCLVREPERFNLELPSLEPDRRLEPVELDGVIGSTLARALSGMSVEEFARFNAGLRRDRTPPGDGFTLLVRGSHAGRTRQILSELPANRRIGWHQRPLSDDESLEEIAAEHGLTATALHALNGISSPDALPAATRFWLPGASTTTIEAAAPLNVHVVRSGESLWTIARRHGLTVQQLLRYNGLNDSRLMPGQRLRLSTP